MMRVMGHARFTYRVRVSARAGAALLAEWGRCHWVWNACVAESRRAWKERRECGPAGLDKMLTGWRAQHDWLREGSSVAQKQTIRDFGKSRAKALKDRKDRLPVRQRAGMPRFKKRDRTAVRAGREPRPACCCRREPTRAQRAAPSCRGTRTARA